MRTSRLGRYPALTVLATEHRREPEFNIRVPSMHERPVAPWVVRILKSILFALLFGAVSSPLHGAQSNQELPEITVRLYNYARATDETLIRAQQTTTQILLEAGVRLFWLQCTLNEHGSAQDPRCHQVRGPAAIWLRVCPREMTPKGIMRPGTLGFSLMPEQGTAMTAWVYFDRIEKLADRAKLKKGALLGTVMAHEIGHLFLGIHSHAPEGIMSIPWDAKTLHKAGLGQPAFTATQADELRKEAVRRLEEGRAFAQSSMASSFQTSEGRRPRGFARTPQE